MSISNLVLPKIESSAMTQEYGKFILGPLERGYGTTIGNSLRRVLLASLPGAQSRDACTAFAVYPGVKI